MATKSISTRIKNKVDSYSTWASSTNVLLNGEIALVRVPTGQSYTNPVTGKSEPVVELLMKVGDGSSTFANLPWLSAKASDVYNWAKTPDVKDVEVAVITGTNTNATNKSLSAWLKETYDKGVTNAAGISSNAAAITTLNGADTVSGSVAQKIKAAIDALDVNDTAVTGQFVTKVSETNGKISVTRAAIAESDLPNIGAAKIIVDSTNSTTLATKLSSVDSDITNLKAKREGHTDDAINTLIDTKINALDVSEPSASGTSTSFIKTAKQVDGKIVVTKANLPTASTSTAGIAKLGASGGAATYDAVDALTTRVSTAEGDIASLKTSVAGGVHFIGTTTTALTDGATTNSITVNSKSHTPTAGDVVLYSNKEFIWTGSAWEELGDLTRVGTLETLTGSLASSSATANQFVTHIEKNSSNALVVKTAQPTAANIKYGDNSNVSTKLGEIDAALATKATSDHVHGNITNDGKLGTASRVVVTDGNKNITVSSAITTTELGYLDGVTSNIQTQLNAKAASEHGTHVTYGGDGTATTVSRSDHTHSSYDSRITALEDGSILADLDFSDPTASGNTTSFIASVSQENGRITATKKTVTSASTSTAGIVKLSSSTSSASTSLAATPSAVKSAYDLASTAKSTAEDAQTRVAAIEPNYVKFNSTDNKLYVGKDGVDEIIFDCGGANN